MALWSLFMSLLIDLANELEQLKGKVRPMLDRIEELKSQIVKFLEVTPAEVAPSTVPVVAPVAEGEKVGRKPRSGTPLKTIVQNILSKNVDGMELKDIVADVHGMIVAGEYSSNAKNLAAVVYQAINALREEKLIHKNKENMRWSTISAA